MTKLYDCKIYFVRSLLCFPILVASQYESHLDLRLKWHQEMIFFLLILESCPAGGPESAPWRPSHSCSRVKNLLQQQLWPKIWSSCGQKCGAAGAEKRCLALSAQLGLHSTPFQLQPFKFYVNEVKVKGWLLVWCQFFFEPEHLPLEGWLVCKMGIEDSIHCIND